MARFIAYAVHVLLAAIILAAAVLPHTQPSAHARPARPATPLEAQVAQLCRDMARLYPRYPTCTSQEVTP